MSHATIETYLSDVLKPRLGALAVPVQLVDDVVDSVRTQMISCIFHWNDEDFRGALLMTGEEDGAFYLPKANADVRSFVVVTIRNSALESVHADSYNPPGQGRRLTADDIKAITSAAIEYFSKVDFSEIAKEIDAPENDRYADLAQRYPAAWDALGGLAYASSNNIAIIEYDPIAFDAKPNLRNLRFKKAVSGLFFDDTPSKFYQVTDDGYSLTIDHGLKQALQISIDGKVPFIGDSLKGISRNLEKLLTIIEYVLGHDLWIVTTNYFIVNGHVERRPKLLKPGHDQADMRRNFQNGVGLTKHHKGWLKKGADV
jgi:hypothetical protein